MIRLSPRLYSKVKTASFFALALLLISTAACESKESKAKKAVREYLKNLAVRDLQVAMFHPGKDDPSKAYIAVDVTYNFATGGGEFQHEYLGYILKQEGQGWAVEKSAGYTKEPGRAEDYIAGKKTP